ncbi:hypothetical protein F5Y16DRAFT_395421 [Xylariaceae sp. FL0255]|nr:hypothetical protein F5Y16DRAFT_395421 [Xylariaceae sp. FL0255]
MKFFSAQVLVALWVSGALAGLPYDDATKREPHLPQGLPHHPPPPTGTGSWHPHKPTHHPHPAARAEVDKPPHWPHPPHHNTTRSKPPHKPTHPPVAQEDLHKPPHWPHPTHHNSTGTHHPGKPTHAPKAPHHPPPHHHHHNGTTTSHNPPFPTDKAVVDEKNTWTTVTKTWPHSIPWETGVPPPNKSHKPHKPTGKPKSD